MLVSTLAGSGTSGSDNGNSVFASFSYPVDLKLDAFENLYVTATANYDNATVGTNKTIAVVYTLDGSVTGNYIVPVNFVITGAKIVDISSAVDVPNASDSEAVTAYPTQVAIDQLCMVKVTGIVDRDLQGATLSVYSTQGVCVYYSMKVLLTNSIALPPVQGVYLGRVITSKGKKFQFKVIVMR